MIAPMRELGPHHFECRVCKARVLVVFSDGPPVVTFDDTQGQLERVVTACGVEIHRCTVSDGRLPGS